MDLLFNELSIQEQFSDIDSFRKALARLMAIRTAARRSGREVSCQSQALDTYPIRGIRLRQAIMRLADRDKRRATLAWLNRTGPFWDVPRLHGPDEWLESRGQVVTDSAVGEAAHRMLHGIDCGLISIAPSDWTFSPVVVTWIREAEGLENLKTLVDNWFALDALEAALEDARPPIGSWDGLRAESAKRFSELVFTDNCFEPLVGVPFSKSAAERFLVLLKILDRYAQSLDRSGQRTLEAQQIYENYFMGANALFSDSSDREKREYRDRLTFVHPNRRRRSLFCTWHGKVRHMTLRLHFSWPVEVGESVYVVYAGPKITKR